jgi:uncharacterized protein (TIGR00369 family)
MDLELQDKHVLITGASRGIGLACARAFLREGARLTLVARDEDTLARAVDELVRADAGAAGRIHHVSADLRRVEDAQRALDAAEAAHTRAWRRWGATSGPACPTIAEVLSMDQGGRAVSDDDTQDLQARLMDEGWVRRQLPGFIGHAGPLWTRRRGETWQYGFLLQSWHMNPAGRSHGGALMTLMDHAMSTVAWEASGRVPCVTVQFDARFLAPVAQGHFVHVDACVVRQTSHLVFAQADMYADGETQVMTAQALLHKIARPAG